MKHFLGILTILVSFACSTQAQTTEPCAYDEYIKELNKAYPGFMEQLDAQYMEAIAHINNPKLNKREDDTIYRIPVVFQVVYNVNAENLDDSLIHSQMEVLNECFRRRNADTTDTRDIFKPVAADTRIEFYLATEDPQGQPTNGIVRTETNLTTFYSGVTTLSLDAVKNKSLGGADPWDTDKYLNIWVCDLSFRNIPIILGYAYPPTNAANWNQDSYVGKNRQGVVLHYGVVGVGNPYDAGQNSTGARTAVHEVGHFLGLRHIWGDGRQGQNGCLLDDFIDDTPITYSRNNSCSKSKNTCSNETPDLPDQIENYMDYTPGTCVNMFTKKQAALMLYNLRNLRSTLPEEIAPEPEIFPATRNVVYPVPVADNMTIELVGVDPTKEYQIQISNMLGQLIHEKPYKLDVEKTEIEMSFLASGVYFFEIWDGEQLLFSQKLLKY